MTDTLRLGCGEDTRPDQWNVDKYDLDGVDEVVDLDEYPWPWDNWSFEHIVAEHVFEHLDSMRRALEECSRVLEPGGTVRVALPLGVNADADPTHQWGESGRPWTWQTPEFLTGRRHWDRDTGLEVVDKSVSSVSHLRGIQGVRNRLGWRWQYWRHGPGEWCFSYPCVSGEFEVVFRRP